MKKYITLIISVVSLAGFAQTIDDLELFNIRELHGTPRFQALGGAFSALGNDPSAVHLNPAAAPVYRFDQLTLSLGFQGTNGNYSLIENETNQNSFNLNLENVGLIKDFKVGKGDWSNLSFGLTYNKLANFNRQYNIITTNRNQSLAEYWLKGNGETDFDGAIGYTAAELEDRIYLHQSFDQALTAFLDNGLLLDLDSNGTVDDVALGLANLQTDSTTKLPNTLRHNRMESGGINEFALTFGGQYKEKFYYGVSVGIPSLNFYQESLIEESGFQPDNIPFDATSYSILQKNNISATGVNLKLGFISRPTHWLRLGFAYESPTLYTVNQIFEYDIVTNFANGDESLSPVYSSGNYSYKVQTPAVYRPGIAFVFGQKGLLSIDYEYTDASRTMAYAGNNSTNVDDNDLALSSEDFTSFTTSAQAIKLGGEYRIGPVALRAGYHYRSSFYKDPQNFRGNYSAISGGLGYLNKNFGIDMAVVNSTFSRQDFVHPFLYTDDTGSQLVDSQISRLNVVLGFNLRF